MQIIFAPSFLCVSIKIYIQSDFDKITWNLLFWKDLTLQIQVNASKENFAQAVIVEANQV